jgi:hypothetical protein
MSAHGRDNFDSLSDDFVNKFKPKQRDFIIEAFLQTDFRTCGVQSPRPFQIECAVGSGFDMHSRMWHREDTRDGAARDVVG